VRRLLLAGLAAGALVSSQDTAAVGWVGIPLQGFGDESIPVPDVVGEASSAAADVILEAALLDLGAVTARCSAAALNEVLGQDPAPGVLVAAGELVDVLVSNGVACPNSARPGVRLRGLRMPGI
jgi:hypothetical protein